MQSKSNSDIDHEQIELLEYAQKRIKQFIDLFLHPLFFLRGLETFLVRINLLCER